jgi:O-antigen ligase
LAKIGKSTDKPTPQFWLLAAFLIVVFVTGGASRIDVQSLPILRPFSVLMCAIAVMSLRRQHLEGHWPLLATFTIALGLALAHVIPLPPSIWQALPGRGELIAVDSLTGLKDQWRPLTIAPANGWHAFSSLFTPLAVLLLGIQLGREDVRRLLPLVIGLGAVSGLVGLLQVISDPQGPLYFYRITNNGSAVGLFSNRNHAATLLACLFPLLAVYASMATGTEDQIRARQLLSASVAIVLVPLILVTGSRSGLISGVLGLVAAGLIYRRPAEGRKVRRGDGRKAIGLVPILGGITAISLGFLTFFFSRAVAIERLFAETTNISRFDYWALSVDMFWKYFPWGSGSGSFVEAFLIVEPNDQLISAYVNRAHNDWIETAVTFGVPGLLLLASSVVLFVLQGYKIWAVADGSRRSVALARAASAAILIIAVASFSDYPLRTPTMMSLFALFLLWLSSARSQQDQTSYRQERGA